MHRLTPNLTSMHVPFNVACQLQFSLELKMFDQYVFFLGSKKRLFVGKFSTIAPFLTANYRNVKSLFPDYVLDFKEKMFSILWTTLATDKTACKQNKNTAFEKVY